MGLAVLLTSIYEYKVKVPILVKAEQRVPMVDGHLQFYHCVIPDRPD